MRQIIFWIHLVCGLLSGLVVAMMSITGIAIAFETEIMEFFDKELRYLSEDDLQLDRKSPDDLVQIVEQTHPQIDLGYIEFSVDANRTIRLFDRSYHPHFLNPHTGQLQKPKSQKVHDIIHKLEMWHRFMGIDGEHWETGRIIAGSFNLIFFILCITGSYLWFPRKRIWRLFKRNLWLNEKARGSARVQNWHFVVGFWNLPVLLILAGTAVIISFAWAHKLVFLLVGEEPSPYRNFKMLMPKAPIVQEIALEENPDILRDIKASIESAFPHWEEIEIQFPKNSEHLFEPYVAYIGEPALFHTLGMTIAHFHPITGEILHEKSWHEQSRGTKTRVWVRFLHTGEAFGIVGKVIVSIAAAFAVILVYTGFVLAYKRIKKMIKTSN